MKNVSLVLTLVFSTFLYSQKVEKLEITKNGVNGFLVKEYQNKESKEIYKSIKDWTEYNIKNAKYATNSNIENEFISFKINSVGTIHFKKKPTWNLDLYVEIRVKENKARIDIKVLEIDGIREGQNSLNISGSGVIMGLYKRNGKAVKGYKKTREEINQTLNSFANRIFESVLGKKDYKKDDW
jgi:hypothetical protein